MKKCHKCGERVRSGALHAVFVYDNAGKKLLRVICGSCALRSTKHKRREAKFRRGHPFILMYREIYEP